MQVAHSSIAMFCDTRACNCNALAISQCQSSTACSRSTDFASGELQKPSMFAPALNIPCRPQRLSELKVAMHCTGLHACQSPCETLECCAPCSEAQHPQMVAAVLDLMRHTCGLDPACKQSLAANAPAECLHQPPSCTPQTRTLCCCPVCRIQWHILTESLTAKTSLMRTLVGKNEVHIDSQPAEHALPDDSVEPLGEQYGLILLDSHFLKPSKLKALFWALQCAEEGGHGRTSICARRAGL